MGGEVSTVRHLSFEVDPQTLANLPALSVYGGAEFLDHEPQPEKWAVPGLIPLGVPTVLASQGGLGKSFLSLQLCVALATGKQFLDFPATDPRAACFFGLEDSRPMFHRRVRNIVDHYRFCGDWTPQDDANFRRNFTAPFVNWKSEGASSFLPDLMPNLELLLVSYADRGILPGVMVLDTLARFSDGDENTVQGVRPVLNACAKLAEYGHTPLVLHHVGKGQDGAKDPKNKPTLADRMSPDWVRGSGAIVGNFRAVLQFARVYEAEAESAGLDPEQARAGQILVFGATKANNGPKGDPRVIVQDEGGRWSVSKESPDILAALRGKRAVSDLKSKDTLLWDLYQAQRAGVEADRKVLAMAHCPTAKNPGHALRCLIDKLRKGGLVQPKSDRLTVAGMDRIQKVKAETLAETEDGDD